jgi:competence protein ComEC
VLDVGQGLSVVIETHSRTLVYDAGPRFSETADAGGRIVAPFLRAAGLRRADGLIISHQDLDHSGGTLSLLQATPVGWFASSLPADHAIVLRARARAKSDNTVMACIAGQRWHWDGVDFTMLHPTRAEYDDHRRRPTTGRASCAWTPRTAARCSPATSRRGPRRSCCAPPAPRCVPTCWWSRTTVRAHRPHRPSFEAVAPRIAVFACGYQNRFGHPRPDIVSRYAAVSARMIRTDVAGAVTLTFAPDTSLVPISARDQRRRYWMDVPEVLPATDDGPLLQ